MMYNSAEGSKKQTHIKRENILNTKYFVLNTKYKAPAKYKIPYTSESNQLC